MKKNIAIIGSGISGLSSAFHLCQLNPDVQVTLFEKNDYFGGHTDTHNVLVNKQKISVDTGFIVFNELNYPVFCEMIKSLNVSYQYSDMSFSVANDLSKLTYNPSKQINLLARPQNFFRNGFLVMLKEIMKFYTQGKELDLDSIDPKLTLGEYLEKNNYGTLFKEEHIYPMCGALWSSSPQQTEGLPLKFVIGFFSNHRMLQVKARPLWRTVTNGSSSYINALKTYLGSRCDWRKEAVIQIDRSSDAVTLITEKQEIEFDEVVFACHADEALALLGAGASHNEKNILGAFEFRTNQMVLHTDKGIMPRSKTQWASWHVHINQDSQQTTMKYSITYWMNRLQNIKSREPILATLNPHQKILENKVLKTRIYTHPTYTSESFDAQKKWSLISGLSRTHFCGAYWGYGFHEDGAVSGLRVACNILDVSDERLNADIRLYKAAG